MTSFDPDWLERRTPLKNLVLVAWLFIMLGLAACNTTRGVGEDVEATGEGIQNTAEDVEEDIEDEDNRM
jgi:predicted small secreted protein